MFRLSPDADCGRPKLRLAVVTAAWLAAVAGGMGLMLNYQLTPGAAAPAPARWPEGSRLQAAGTLPQLLVFVHPRCPCSRATLGELSRLTTRCSGELKTTVVFVIPNENSHWLVTDLWQTAAGTPGVSTFGDHGGREAERFGARTSGHAVLYDHQGRLQFCGGITASRGHHGDNAGSREIAAAVLGGSRRAWSTPVYGCPLQSPACGRTLEFEEAGSCCRQ